VNTHGAFIVVTGGSHVPVGTAAATADVDTTQVRSSLQGCVALQLVPSCANDTHVWVPATQVSEGGQMNCAHELPTGGTGAQVPHAPLRGSAQ
jgi:hypothetical protein